MALGPYQKQSGTWANIMALSILAAATVTTAGVGASVEVGDRGTVRADLVVTGSPAGALDVTLETSADGVTWVTLGTFPQATAAGTTHKQFSGCDRFVRARWTPSGGSPSFTFSIAAEAV